MIIDGIVTPFDRAKVSNQLNFHDVKEKDYIERTTTVEQSNWNNIFEHAKIDCKFKIDDKSKISISVPNVSFKMLSKFESPNKIKKIKLISK